MILTLPIGIMAYNTLVSMSPHKSRLDHDVTTLLVAEAMQPQYAAHRRSSDMNLSHASIMIPHRYLCMPVDSIVEELHQHDIDHQLYNVLWVPIWIWGNVYMDKFPPHPMQSISKQNRIF